MIKKKFKIKCPTCEAKDRIVEQCTCCRTWICKNCEITKLCKNCFVMIKDAEEINIYFEDKRMSLGL